MADASTTAPCPPPSELQKQIQALEKETKQQDQSDAKLKLADLTKIGGEVEKAEENYNKEYESLKFAFQQSGEYIKLREPLFTGEAAKVTESERKIIKERIVDCATKQLAYLKSEWVTARNKIPGLTKTYHEAQHKLADDEEPYREALAYKSNQNELDALQGRSTKEIDAKNFRGAYFLVELDMKNRLNGPLAPKDFNTDLESKALTYYGSFVAARIAKTALDQENADLQKKKKAYDDAKAKFQDNVLKQIADERFTAASDQPTAGTAPS